MTTKTLAISEGWTLKKLKPIQRIEPFTSRPMPGISTITSKAKAPTSMVKPIFCQVAIGTIMVTMQANTPMATYTRWRNM
ncbi:hypothetical protein D3C72_1900120 [compost metagenome]